MKDSPYPEHQKLTAISNKSQECYDFLEWLADEGIILAKYDVFTETCRGCDHTEAHPQGGGPFPTRQCEHPRCDCDRPDHGDPEALWPYLNRRESLLARYFDIDLRIIEQEKQAMLASLRELNKEEEERA